MAYMTIDTICGKFDEIAANSGSTTMIIAIDEWIRIHANELDYEKINSKNINVKPHITEQKYPEQTKRFREILDEMYQTHLDKNADYSSWNINATGLIGLVVRFWDKSARIMNLCGFDIGTGDFSGNKQNLVKDETIIDTFKDAGVYSIIARIWAEGKWGK